MKLCLATRFLIGVMGIIGIVASIGAIAAEERQISSLKHMAAFVSRHPDWCGNTVIITIRSTSSEDFGGDRKDLQRLLGGTRAILGEECPKATRISVVGLTNGVERYRGIAAKETNWALAESKPAGQSNTGTNSISIPSVAPAPEDVSGTSLTQSNAGSSSSTPMRQLLKGSYSGLYACGSIPITVTMNINVGASGAVSGTYSESANHAAPAQLGIELGEGQLAGAYDAETFAIALRVQPARGARTTRPLSLRGVVRGSGQRLVLLREDHFGASCTLLPMAGGTAAPAEWQRLRSFASEKGPQPIVKRNTWAIVRLPGTVSRALSNSCDQSMIDWLSSIQTNSSNVQEMSAIPSLRNMFSDPYFKRYFGKSFSELSPSEIDNNDNRLQSACSKNEQVQAMRLKLPPSLFTGFKDMPGLSHFDKVISAVALAEARAWSTEIQAFVDRAALEGMDPARADKIVSTAKPLLSQLWSKERESFDRDVQSKKRPMTIAWLGKQLDSGLSNPPHDASGWEALASIVGRARSTYPFLTEVDVQPLATRLGRRTSSAATIVFEKVSAAATVDASSIETLTRWPESVPMLWVSFSPEAQAAVREKIAQRRVQLVAQMVDAERAALSERLSTMSGGTALAELVAMETRTSRIFGSMVDEPLVAKFALERALLRTKLQGQHAEDLRTTIRKASTLTELDRLKTEFLVVGDEDKPEGQKLMASIEGRRSSIKAEIAEAEKRERAAEAARKAAGEERTRQAAEARKREVLEVIGGTIASDTAPSGKADDCDKLAASPLDVAKPATIRGVTYERIDAARAIPACAAAAKQDPDPRVLFQYCRALDKAGRNTEALAFCERAAEDGHAAAAHFLGRAFLLGENVLKDSVKGESWLRAAAAGGVGEAQSLLGILTYERKDFAAAFPLFKQAATKGVRSAQYNVAVCYSNGEGVSRDRQRAARLYQEVISDIEGDAPEERDLELLSSAKRNLADLENRFSQQERAQSQRDESERKLNETMRDIYLEQSREMDRR